MDKSEEESDYEIGGPREIYKQETITWDEMFTILKEWIAYGDDSFEDEYSELLEIKKYTTDQTHKKNLKIMLKIMDFLREKCYD